MSILGMDYSIFTVIGSIVLAVLVGLVVIGGLKRIAKVSERVIPAMVVLYEISLLAARVGSATASNARKKRKRLKSLKLRRLVLNLRI